MKRVGMIVLALAFFGFGLSSLKLSDEDREKAIEHLNETKENMMKTVEGLSDEQLHYKPSPESWSIAECVEHLAITENAIIEMVNGAVQVTADMSRRSEVAVSDEQLLQMITDRSNKIKTSEAFEPSGKFGNYEETLEAFTNKREENIEYVKNTEDDLRNHYAELPFGTVDAYQVILFMSGHTARHTLQMAEVKEDPGFPEN